MEWGSTTLAFYGVGAAAVATSLATLRRRLQLSKAKHASLTGHARMARWVASFVPFYQYVSRSNYRDLAVLVKRRGQPAELPGPAGQRLPVHRYPGQRVDRRADAGRVQEQVRLRLGAQDIAAFDHDRVCPDAKDIERIIDLRAAAGGRDPKQDVTRVQELDQLDGTGQGPAFRQEFYKDFPMSLLKSFYLLRGKFVPDFARGRLEPGRTRPGRRQRAVAAWRHAGWMEGRVRRRPTRG